MKRTLSLLLSLLMVFTLLGALPIQASAENNYYFVNPITGSVQGVGNDHSGVDIFAPVGTPVYAMTSGYIQYSEYGHTHDYPGCEDIDTKYSVKVVMDEPIELNGLTYTNAFYTHLSQLVYDIPDSDYPTVHVNAGDLIGYSGLGRGVAHLHFSFEWVNPLDGNDWRHMTTDEVMNTVGWSRGEQITANADVSPAYVEPTYPDMPNATTLTFEQIKAKFPEGKYWNASSVDSYTSSPCKCLHKQSHLNGSASATCTCKTFDGGMQCWGFAQKLAYDMYGTKASTWNKLSGSSASSYINSSLKPGDIVRYNNNGHSVMVVAVSGNNVTVGECNWGGNCIIKYSRVVTKSTLSSSVTWVEVAPNSNPFNNSTPQPSLTIDTRYPTPFKAYGANGGVKYPVYSTCSESSSIVIHIYSNYNGDDDNCTINEVYTNGWCKVTVPVSGSSDTRVGYTKLSNFIPQYDWYAPWQVTVAHYNNAYRRSDWAVQEGHIYDKDDCTIVGDYNAQNYLLICPWSNNTRQLVWTDKSTLFHNFGAEIYCDETYHKHICSICQYTEWPYHSWTETSRKEATCTANGSIVYTCSGCKGTKTETIAAKGHTAGAAATCTAPQKCTVCGTQLKAALGHSYGSWTKVDNTNHKRTCSRCSNVETAAHSWGAGTVTTKPTCTSTGVKTFTCSTCKGTKTETIAKTGHTYGTDWKSDETNHWHVCTSCNTEKSAIAAHTWDAGKVTKEPTKTATGVKTYTCTVCSRTKTETIPVLDPDTYTITYNANGGTGAPSAQTKTEGVALTLSSVKPTRDGYTFLGWATSAGATTAQYQPGGTYTEDASVTLYAVWKKNEEPAPDADIVFTLSEITATSDSTIEVDLRVSGTTEIEFIYISDFTFDTSALEFIGMGKKGELIEACLTPDNAYDNATHSFTMGYSSPIKPNGSIATLVFKVKENAEEKDYEIGYTAITTHNRKEVKNTSKKGKIRVKNWVEGDFNGDGEITMADAVYYIGWIGAPFLPQYNIPFSDEYLDFNKDGKNDMADAVYYIGWVGAPFLPQYHIDW